MIKNKVTSFETESKTSVSVKALGKGKCELEIGEASVILTEEEAQELSNMFFEAFAEEEECELPGSDDVKDFMDSLQEMIDKYHDGHK